MGKYILSVISLISTTLSPVSVANVNAPVEQGGGVENQSVVGSAERISLDFEKELTLWVTAYSSSPEETDDTPFVTALGTEVRDGIIATNLLPFGTKVIIPELFDDKIFTVEDRMHKRKENFLDIWMPTKKEAKEFGINYTRVMVLN